MTMEHIERSFAVTLHINHPSIDPEVISRELSLQPRSSHRVGQAKVTPRGTPLKGVHECAGWSFAFDTSGITDLSEFLAIVVEQLETHASFLTNLVREEGRIELFCGIFADGNWDESFPRQILRRLADLSVDLRLDVYPNKTRKKTKR